MDAVETRGSYQVGKWSKEELTQLFSQIHAISEGKSVYRASIDLSVILNRKYTSCYDKIQKVRNENSK